MKSETIVVGGGIAGMSCALKLKEHDREVALITEELGGRICYDPQLKNNFGAVFFMENYKNAKKLVLSTGLMAVDLKDLMLHSSETKVFRGTSLTMAKSLPQMLKFMNFMKAHFMPDYNRYKDDCEHMPVEEAFKRHPRIRRYFNMRASDFIEELGIDTVADNFVSKFAYACTGSKIKELNALDFLNVAQGVVIPIYNFSFDAEAYKAKLGGQVYIETITKITKAEDGWTLASSIGEEHQCKNLVVATTGLTTQKLLGIEEIRQPTTLVSYLVEGHPTEEIAAASAHYFGDVFDVIAITSRGDGTWNVYSRKEIDLSRYFTSYRVIKYRVWPEALFTYGHSVLKQDWDENLWIAGDVNGLGLEPAAVSGIYAANRILGVC